MQDAVPVGTGAMAAILGMEARKVIEGCAEAVRSFGVNTNEVVEAVNFNDPAQTVIAGSKAAVEKACEMLKAGGAKRALPLPVSAPFHSSLMKPAAEKLREKLAATVFAPPQIPVINNIEVQVESSPGPYSGRLCMSRRSARCDGSNASRPSRRVKSPRSSSAVRARSWPGCASGSIPN
jgi:[acyl-carrier-protein] S-malonyltransferase